jgi:hypothetical protein
LRFSAPVARLAVITHWGACAAIGSCCINNVCHLDFTAAGCAAQGGTFYADNDPSFDGDNSFMPCRNAGCDNSTAPCTLTCHAPPNSCPGDIVPEEHGNRAVNVDDLLRVITDWGPCPINETKTYGQAPRSVHDCESTCDHKYPDHGQDYADCVDACVESLRQQGLIE